MMKTNRPAVLLAVLAALCAPPSTTSAQERIAPVALTPDARDRVIDGILDALDRGYVFPAVARDMRRSITSRRASGEYTSVANPAELATLLTRHLQDVSHDKHLRVRHGDQPRPIPRPQGASAPAIISGAEILPGNIGYVEVRSFSSSARAAAAAVAKEMSVVADADALIIDIRRNGGGAPEAVALVSSYLFGEEPVHLNSLYFRPADTTEDFYTFRSVEGKRFGPSKPVYVLTSKATFSAAEEFAYNLQSRKRATIVGETSGGGAHPGGPRDVGEGFSVFVPAGRAINPITKTNWEGVGVIPEVRVPADSALSAALGLARAQKIRPRGTG
jgi:retinol-binding protein 3